MTKIIIMNDKPETYLQGLITLMYKESLHIYWALEKN